MMNFIYFDELESANIYAKEMAKNGSPQWTVIIADRQNGGYGRMKRRFFSPDSCGLYMSIILRPALPPDKCLYITTAAAVAAAEAIEEPSGQRADIKWVNDIYINGKKVCGILTEAAFYDESSIDYAILGIGVNLYEPEGGYDPSIQNIAGALFDKKPDRDLRTDLARLITAKFETYYRELENKSFLYAYRQRCFVIGKQIRVITPKGEYDAEAIGIDDELGLIVKTENKEITLHSAEVSIKV